MSSSAKAYAKLNLYLHILGARADGYHALESLVVFTDLADTLTVEKSAQLELKVIGEFAAACGKVEENLVRKAARLLQKVTNTDHGARITLEKNIPVGAGMGGGSADAAAALTLLNDHWQLGLSPAELKKVGKKLGADVVLCLEGRPLIARGIGDELEIISEQLPPLHTVLVYPGKPLSTAQVYAAFNSPPEEDRRHSSPHSKEGVGVLFRETLPPQGERFLQRLASTRNDLQRPAVTLMPEVAEVLLALETAPQQPPFVRMTGSGSACFALMKKAEDAMRLATQLRTQCPGWWVRETAVRPQSR